MQGGRGEHLLRIERVQDAGKRALNDAALLITPPPDHSERLACASLPVGDERNL